MATSSAASICRRLASSGPQRLASARLSSGASVTDVCGRFAMRASERLPHQRRLQRLVERGQALGEVRARFRRRPVAASAPRRARRAACCASARSSARASAGMVGAGARARSRDARHVLALQVAADERNVLARGELAPDRRGAASSRARRACSASARIAHLELVVEQALRDVRSEQRRQHRRAARRAPAGRPRRRRSARCGRGRARRRCRSR